MGIILTQEKLDRIKRKKLSKTQEEDININNNNNIYRQDNYYNILKNIYSHIYKKNIKNDLEKEVIINKNSKLIIKNNEKVIIDEEINNILFRNNKSIDFSTNNLSLDLTSNEKNIKNNCIIQKNQYLYSEEDNESNNSDYIDISKKFMSLNRINYYKNEIKILKSKKIRDSYYHKLIIKNQWNPLKKDKYFNNLFFFDWDDTLFCTSYLLPTGALYDMEITKKDKEIISNLDNLAYKLLLKTINLGIVFIITNGAPGWVELSSVKFYPKTAKLLSKIKLISARGLYEKKLPGDGRQWKIFAFKYAIDSIEIKRNIPTNIICIGDCNIEMEATYYIKEFFSNSYLKIIKFKESPTHIELEKELSIIFKQIDAFLINYKNLSIKVTKKKED